ISPPISVRRNRNGWDQNSTRRPRPAQNRRPNRQNRAGTGLASRFCMNVIGELLLVTSSIVVSLAVSRLALNELFRLVRITPRTPHDGGPRYRAHVRPPPAPHRQSGLRRLPTLFPNRVIKIAHLHRNVTTSTSRHPGSV